MFMSSSVILFCMIHKNKTCYPEKEFVRHYVFVNRTFFCQLHPCVILSYGRGRCLAIVRAANPKEGIRRSHS